MINKGRIETEARWLVEAVGDSDCGISATKVKRVAVKPRMFSEYVLISIDQEYVYAVKLLTVFIPYRHIPVYE